MTTPSPSRSGCCARTARRPATITSWPTGTHRLDTLQAAILEVKLRHLPDWNQRRRDAAAALREGLAGSSVISPAPAAADADHVYHLFVVRSERARRSARPPRFPRGRQRRPLPDADPPAAGLRGLGLGRGDLPVAERLASENCSLPIFPAIEDWHIAEIVAAVESFEAAASS